MGRYENYNYKPDNWFGTYSPLCVNTWRNCVVKSKYIRKDYDGYYGNNITYNNIELHGGIDMKNREKYRNEILNSVFRGNEYCKFAKKNVLPNLTDCTNGECNELKDCWLCRDIFAFWLDEEYEEPEVDWNNIAVDIPILVRESKDREWKRRYFAKYKDGIIFAWVGGNTSWTALGDTTK